MGQRGVASAEVVHRKAHAQRHQLLHFGDGVFQVLNHDAFGDFQFEDRTGQVVAQQAVPHPFYEVVLEKLPWADVHAQAESPGVDQALA